MYVGYLTPNPFSSKSFLFQTIQFRMSTQLHWKKNFYFKLFRLDKQFYFKYFSLAWVRSLIEKTFLFQLFRLDKQF